MKLAAEFITPTQIVLVRVLFGFVPVAVYAWLTGVLKLAHLRHLGHLLVMALVGTIAYYYGFVKAASLLHSGVVGALSGLTPIFAWLLATLLIADEKATRFKLLGIAIGFIGVVLIARPFDAGVPAASLAGLAYALIGSFSIGASFAYVKKFVLPLGIPATALITYQLGIALLVLLCTTDLDGITDVGAEPWIAAGLVIGLGILGTGVAYLIYYYIIDQLGAVAAASVAYLPPVIALLIGAILAGEPILLLDYIAAALILAGVGMINRTRSG